MGELVRSAPRAGSSTGMGSHPPGRAHQALRRATAAAHRALDHHPLLQRLTARDLTRAQYAQSLAAMYAPHVRLERMVHDSRHHLESGLALSARLEPLEADLLDLGWPVPAVSPITPGPADGRAAWWGRVYVLEGSRQGSAVIARCIHASLGDSVPCRFFAGATAPGAHSALLATLTRALEGDDALDQAVAGARAAFADYKAGLDGFDCEKRGVRTHQPDGR